jgi:hypothetical protein
MARKRRPQTGSSRTAAKPVPPPAGIARRAGTWVLHELREMIAPTAFFFVGFNLILLTTNLILADYSASSAGTFMLATVSALIVGKSVLIANAIPLLRRYDERAPLIEPILFRTFVYSVIVALVRVLEHFIEFARVDNHPMQNFVQHMVSTFSWHRFTAVQIWISVLFLMYVTGVELADLLGEGELRRLLFSRRPSKLQLTRRQQT